MKAETEAEFGVPSFRHNILTRLDRTERKLDNGLSQLGVVIPEIPAMPASVANMTVEELRKDIAARLCRIETKVSGGFTQLGVVPNDSPSIAVKGATGEVHVTSLGVTFLNLMRALENHEDTDFAVVYNGIVRGYVCRPTGVDV